MKVDPLEFEIGVTSVKARMADCEVSTTQGGEIDIKATAINVDVQDEVHQVLDEPTDWSEDAIKEVVRNAWLEGKEYWPDTSDKDWTENRLIRETSKEYTLMVEVIKRQPVTANHLKDEFDSDMSVKNAINRLKSKNLIVAIDSVSGSDVLVPTHLAIKEYSINNELEYVE